MSNLSLINQVRSQTTCAPPVTCIQDDMAIHDFDIAMVNVSICSAQYLVVNRIIGGIRFCMTKKEYSKIANESHHSVTPELFARN